MKNYLLSFCLLISSTLFSQNVYQLDTERSKLTWTGYSVVSAYTFTGTIKTEEGFLEVNNLGEIINAEVIIDMNTIDNENNELVEHLKSKDFFYIEKYPFSQFSLWNAKDNNATGALQMCGVEKKINMDFEHIVVMDGIIIRGKVTIDRTRFKIKYNSPSFFKNIGSKGIEDNFDLEFELVFTISNN